ncbi:MAG: hypothetical protein K5656_06870 [Lachnospiraceae bacterium]|nr:hypothetical protein [Lachnospiraceae bacterium]
MAYNKNEVFNRIAYQGNVVDFIYFSIYYEAEKVCEYFCRILGYSHDSSKHLKQYHSDEEITKESEYYIVYPFCCSFVTYPTLY